jgi:hypothetical protein
MEAEVVEKQKRRVDYSYAIFDVSNRRRFIFRPYNVSNLAEEICLARIVDSKLIFDESYHGVIEKFEEDSIRFEGKLLVF